jgi:basic membrane protein A and related proteins
VHFGRRAWLRLAAAGTLGLAAVPRRARAGDYKVALILTGSISDGGWNQQGYEGLKQLEGAGGYTTKFSENVKQSDIPQVVRGYADDGYDLVIGHGFQFGSLFMEVGPEYSKQKFFATTFAPNGAVPPNVMFINTRPYDVAYGMGALAALLSTKHGVGLVGGGDNPTQQTMSRVFKKAAEATVPGLKAFAVVTGDYNDAAKGRETALAMIGNGADVITHTADLTGIGAIKGAAEAKATVIGAFSDQTALAPDLMATSIVNDNAAIVKMVAAMGKDGSFKGGGEWAPELAAVWYPKYGAGEYNEKLVAAETWAKFKTIWSDVASGKIDVTPLTK